MSVQEERNRVTKLIIAEQEACQNTDPETCDVCHAFNLLLEKVLDA